MLDKYGKYRCQGGGGGGRRKENITKSVRFSDFRGCFS